MKDVEKKFYVQENGQIKEFVNEIPVDLSKGIYAVIFTKDNSRVDHLVVNSPFTTNAIDYCQIQLTDSRKEQRTYKFYKKEEIVFVLDICEQFKNFQEVDFDKLDKRERRLSSENVDLKEEIRKLYDKVEKVYKEYSEVIESIEEIYTINEIGGQSSRKKVRELCLPYIEQEENV